MPDEPLDVQRIRRHIAYLDSLPDLEFADVVAQVVMTRGEDDPELRAALRTPALVAKSLAAVRYHIDEANARLKRPPEDDPDWRRRQEHFKHAMGMERRLLERVRGGVLAQKGVVPNAPNPRQRAYERLAKKHYEDFRRFLGDEQAKLKRRKKEQKQAARRAAAQRRRRR